MSAREASPEWMREEFVQPRDLKNRVVDVFDSRSKIMKRKGSIRGSPGIQPGPERRKALDAALKVTNASVSGTKTVNVSKSLDKLLCKISALKPFKYHPYEGERVILLAAACKVGGIPFTARFYRPNVKRSQWESATREGKDKIVCEIRAFDDGSDNEMWKKYGPETWLKYSVSIWQMSKHEGESKEYGNHLPMHLSAESGFKQEFEMGSYAAVVEASEDNGFLYPGSKIRFDVWFTVFCTSFKPAIVKRRIREANEDSDICLRVDYTDFFASKAVLSLHSDVFKTMFNSDFAEKNAKIIEIPDAPYYIFEDFLLSMYPEGGDIHNGNVAGILGLAHRYNVTKTINICYDFLMKDTEHNCFLRCGVAAKYGYLHMFDQAVADLHKDGFKTDEYYSKLDDGLKLRIFDGIAECARKEREERGEVVE